jgi:hypothetical protein
MMGSHERRIGKSEKGVYCAYQCADNVVQIWVLNELRGRTEWVFMRDINLKPLAWPHVHRDFRQGSWILQQQDKIDQALVLKEKSEWDPDDKDNPDDDEEKSEWDPDDEDTINTQHWVGTHQPMTYDFLGFHPYKEIVILMMPTCYVMAYHLKTSKVRGIGSIYMRDTVIEVSFPYTPCWMGPLPGASEHLIETQS